MASQQHPDPSSRDEAIYQMRKLLPVDTNNINNPNFVQDTVQRDAEETRIIVHHKYPALVESFLAHKRQHGSNVEKALYGTPDSWTWRQQVARLIAKRPLVFMDRNDYTVLRNGYRAGGIPTEWNRVGTDAEGSNSHVKLAEYLSYDEMMLGSLLGVSGPSYFINSGKRYNKARPDAPGTFQDRGVIMGLVGARFERSDRMDSVFMQPKAPSPNQHEALSAIFMEFFGETRRPSELFDERMYKARMRITVDILLLEANDRAKLDGQRKAYVHVVGLGLGVWQVDSRQPQYYVGCFNEAIHEMGPKLQNIGTLDFSWVDVPTGVQAQLVHTAAQHGIEVIFSKREPAAKLPPQKQDQLLVLSYAWDGNAFPGNEYWDHALTGSGDPAAACMSTISELHNPIINPEYLQRIKILSP
ncbi:uncharacterized protein JN550_009131 [Neoarthrinium moseri]|uniref:uncharacterized protein n=1 Tax=Neoarthrinium moseri TaxID=1658444 RepID=UPI001FDDF438|nr:uncharacterized protein JN550_009131 [Neoarthrinium moseri]KAI1864111.1 hypothetical protein JN550_009131 [Neoarthrinium moseri]